MAGQAYATVIIPENYQAIMSEAGGNFSKEEMGLWVEKHGPGGLFVRVTKSDPDEEKHPLDCQLFTSDQFHQLFNFEHGDPEVLFRHIVEKK